MMTTNDATRTHRDQCIICRDVQLLNAYDLCWRCLEVECGQGGGEEVGLPLVPAEKLDDAIQWAAEHIYGLDPDYTMSRAVHFENCMFCTLLDDACGECGDESADEIPVDDEDHIIVDGFVLVCCEGFHTPAIRWAGLNV
ncbi:MAG: hypothetical protein AB7L09_22015 [Nitrospira sp.]